MRAVEIHEALQHVPVVVPEQLRSALRLSARASHTEAREALRWALQRNQLTVLAERRTPTLQRGVRLPDPRKPAAPPAPPTPLELPAPRRYLRVELGALRYRVGSPVHLPTVAQPCPWAALVAACAHLGQKPARAVHVVAHSHATEAQLGGPRLKLLRAFLDADEATWVALMTAHGSLLDTQVFLQYLAQRRRWPTPITSLTGTPTAETAKAVEAFQSTYNDLFHESIYVDGVVGEQTLGAIGRVAREDFLTWLRVNGAELGPLYRLPDDAFIEQPTGIPSKWGVSGSTLDIVVVPSDQPPPRSTGDASDIYADDVILTDIPISSVVDPMLRLLIVEMLELDGRPIAHQDYELRVGDDHRQGTTKAHGEIIEQDVAGERVEVRLADGRIAIFHDELPRSA